MELGVCRHHLIVSIALIKYAVFTPSAAAAMRGAHMQSCVFLKQV